MPNTSIDFERIFLEGADLMPVGETRRPRLAREAALNLSVDDVGRQRPQSTPHSNSMPGGQNNPSIGWTIDIELKVGLQAFNEKIVAARFEGATDARIL
jgi:hypothetical protein